MVLVLFTALVTAFVNAQKTFVEEKKDGEKEIDL